MCSLVIWFIFIGVRFFGLDKVEIGVKVIINEMFFFVLIVIGKVMLLILKLVLLLLLK